MFVLFSTWDNFVSFLRYFHFFLEINLNFSWDIFYFLSSWDNFVFFLLEVILISFFFLVCCDIYIFYTNIHFTLFSCVINIWRVCTNILDLFFVTFMHALYYIYRLLSLLCGICMSFKRQYHSMKEWVHISQHQFNILFYYMPSCFWYRAYKIWKLIN